jgi:L-iditol 2-dehydrogenase
LLIRVTACGICGTDVMKVYDPSTPKPVQLGHEIVGTVVSTGQRVAVAHHAPDPTSHYTKRGSATQDPQFKASNISPGGFAEFIRVPADLVPHTVIPIPDHVPDMRAVFMEPLACCLRALERVPVKTGDTLAIVGVGSIGMLFVPLLKHAGAQVIAADVREDRLTLARHWGAAATSLASSADLPAQARRLSNNRGADIVILTTTNTDTLRLALATVRDGGTIIPFGVKPGVEMPFDVWQIYRREISVVTSYSATPQGLTRAIELLSGKGFELESLISHKFQLDDAGQGFELLHRAKASKVVVLGL